MIKALSTWGRHLFGEPRGTLKRRHRGPSRHRAPGPFAAGTTLLEVLLSLIVGAPLLAALLSSAARGARWSSRTALFHTSARGAVRAESLLTLTVHSRDRSPLGISPRIHPPGAITFASDPAGPLLNPALAPESHSTAISTLELAVARTQLTAPSSDASAFSVCPRWGETLSPDYRLVLGLANDGVCLFRLVQRARLDHSGCTVVRLERVPSATLRCAVSDPAFIQALVPVTREYTLYVDTAQQLRFLSHDGARIVENQPIVRGIKQLTIAAERFPAGDFEGYHATITGLDDKVRTIFLAPRTAGSRFFSFLLHRP